LSWSAVTAVCYGTVRHSPDTIMEEASDGEATAMGVSGTPSLGSASDMAASESTSARTDGGDEDEGGQTCEGVQCTAGDAPAEDPARKPMVGIYIPWIAYGGKVEVDHALSLAGTLLALQREGLSAQVFSIQQESLVPRARNLAAALFLQSPMSHMLFADVDVSFDAEDVIKMLRMDVDVIGGAYRLKSDDFGWSFDGAYEATSMPGIYKTQYISTGFTLISKRALEMIMKTHTDRIFKNHIPSYPVKTAYDFFPAGIDASGLYLSEDYGFSQLCTSSGVDLLLYGNATLKHLGRAQYVGNLHEATQQVAEARAAGRTKEEATKGFGLAADQVWLAAATMQPEAASDN